ncbi:MAG: glycosyltransferase family 2 protein [Chloroflexi bacterium]|nr:glycosyltransferase family 2 protein [Chloroflexota bacterium]
MAPLESLSIIIPVYNEQQNIPLLYKAVVSALQPLKNVWEIIFVDDGSEDDSLKEMEIVAAQDHDHVRVIELRRNFGQTAAIAAGFDYAKGDIVIPMDADLQNDPSDIPLLLQKIEEGYDVVSGWRKNREDPFLTRTLPSLIANWLISAVTGEHLHDYGCTLKAYRREVINGFRLYGEMHRFIPVYAASVGARITEVVVHHHPRRFGKAKYGLERTLKVILDLFTVKFLSSYADKPIYLFGGSGLLFFLISGIMLLFLFIRRIFYSISPFDSPLFVTSLMFMIFGFQSILMGLIAELLMRTYHESQGKPTYLVKKVVNGSEDIHPTEQP